MTSAAPGLAGLGLRPQHYPQWQRREPAARLWLEALADNYLMQVGGPGLFHLERLAEGGRMLLHGVGMDIGGTARLDEDYLASLASLARRVRPTVISDHLCFTRSARFASFELLPLPLTEKTLLRVCERVAHVQEKLGARFSLENVSSYVRWAEDEMSELEFLREVCARTGAGVLLDVNNLAVSAWNHPKTSAAVTELGKLRAGDVTQYHLAGPREEPEPEGKGGVYLLDTHDRPVRAEAIALFKEAWRRFGARPFVLERDDEGASLEEMEAEIATIAIAVTQDVEPAFARTREDAERRDFRDVPNAMPGVRLLAKVDDTPLFLGSLHGDETATAALRARLAPESSHRLGSYRDAYETRLATALPGSVLDKAAELIGREALERALLEFYRATPPSAILLPETLAGFAAFLRRHPLAERGPHVVALVELALARWRVLIGPDPVAATEHPGSFRPDTLYFARAHELLEVEAPVFGLWNGGDGDFVEKGRDAVLLWKSSATELVMLRVPDGLRPLVRALSAGASLVDALEEMDDASAATMKELSPFIARLVAERGLGPR